MSPDEAVRQAARTVYKLAAQIDPNGYGREDLIQEGFVGALLAARTYDPSSGVRFATYAGHRIYGAMVDSLRRGNRKRVEVSRDAGHLRELSHEPAVDGDTWMVDDADEVEAVLSVVRETLPPAVQKAVLSLFGVGGRLNEGQLCDRLKLPQRVVQWMRHKGLEVIGDVVTKRGLIGGTNHVGGRQVSVSGATAKPAAGPNATSAANGRTN